MKVRFGAVSIVEFEKSSKAKCLSDHIWDLYKGNDEVMKIIFTKYKNDEVLKFEDRSMNWQVIKSYRGRGRCRRRYWEEMRVERKLQDIQLDTS